MDVFLVSYHAKVGTNYRRFADHMATRNGVRLHRTLWVLPGPTDSWLAGAGSALALRDSLIGHAGEHDIVAVFELTDSLDWATHNAKPAAVRRLQKRLGGREQDATAAPMPDPDRQN